MSSIALSDRQKGVVAAALTTVSIVVVGGVAIWFLKLSLNFFTYFSGVFLPLAMAGILAMLFKPYFNWLLARLKYPVLAVAAIILSIVIPAGLIAFYFGALIVGQAVALIEALPVWMDNVKAYVQEHLPVLRGALDSFDLRAMFASKMEAEGLLGDSAKAVGKGLFSTWSFLSGLAASVVSWLVMPVYFIFMLQAPALTRDKLELQLPFLKPQTRKNAVYLATEFGAIMVAFFRGQLIVAFCQGLLFAVGFALVGLPHGFVLGLSLGFLNIVPYLGNIVGLAVVLPLAWFHPGGGLVMLAGVGVVFVVVQMIEGYLLTPHIMGQRTGLHPMAIIFAIFFWGTAFHGLLGMILAIPLTAFLVVFWRLVKQHYIKEWI